MKDISMRDKIYILLILLCTVGSGFWLGFIYAPNRWPELASHVFFDVPAIFIGMALGYLISCLIVILYELFGEKI